MHIIKTATVVGVLTACFILIPTALYGGKHEVAMPIAVGVLLLLILLSRYLPSFTGQKRASWVLLGFIVWALIHSFFLTSSPYTAIISLMPLLAGALIFWLFQSIRINKQSFRPWLSVLLIGTACIILFGLYIYLSPQFESLRFGATFRRHNALAGFLAALVPLALFTSGYRQRWRLVWFAVTILFVASLILTFSRGGWIATSLGLLTWFILIWRQTGLLEAKRLIILTVLTLAIGGSLAWGLFQVKTVNYGSNNVKETGVNSPSPFAGEMAKTGETAVNARFEYWRAAWQIFKEKPIVGHGFNSFEQEYRRIQTDPRFFSVDPHNLLLKLLAELGLIGAIIFFVFLWQVFRPRLQAIWQKRDLDPLAPSLLAGLLGLVIHYGVDLDLTFPSHYLLFFSLAAMIPKTEHEV